jgi:hypothetical protein
MSKTAPLRVGQILIGPLFNEPIRVVLDLAKRTVVPEAMRRRVSRCDSWATWAFPGA